MAIAELELAPSSVRRLTDAESLWLAELYEANFIPVFNQCQRLLRSPEDAVDATHEVFLRAVKSLTPVSGVPAGSWLATVARNHCLDLIRRRKRLDNAMTTLAASSPCQAEPEGVIAGRQTVDTILGQLGLRERQALWQSAVERRPIGEIARNFGLNYMAAAQLVHRARRRAAAVAAKIAAILGVLRFTRVTRRAKLAWLAAVTVPVALATPAVVPRPPSPSLARPAVSAVPHRVASAARAPAAGGSALLSTAPALSYSHAVKDALGKLPVAIPSVGTGALHSLQNAQDTLHQLGVSVQVGSLPTGTSVPTHQLPAR